MSALHVGKRVHEAKTMVTEAMHDELVRRANELRCSPAELLCDALYLALTGKTYSEHVANDRRAAFHVEGRDQGDNKAVDCSAVPRSRFHG
jgi:transcriptional regulator of met regulon